MSDPYEVLELKPDAGETEIRQRYLELVRAFPPDQAPERFAAIHAAYASLRDPSERLRQQIFGLEVKSDSFESLTAELHARMCDVRVPLDTLLAWADSP